MEISNGIVTAAINPLGAEMISLTFNDREYIWEGNAKHWAKRSPVLFPVVGCLKNNSYFYEGKKYALNRHGFARDNIFTVESHTENSILFSLKANNDTTILYPFDFELQIRYTLNEKTVEIDYMVKNRDDKGMPFSIGGHPAFALPNNLKDYSLRFTDDEELVSTPLEEGLITHSKIKQPAQNGVLTLDYSLFKNDALVFTNLKSGAVELLEKDVPLLKVVFEKMPHLGIWSKDKAPFICIEPWHGYADLIDTTGNIIEKEGIIILEPGKEYNTGFAIHILN